MIVTDRHGKKGKTGWIILLIAAAVVFAVSAALLLIRLLPPGDSHVVTSSDVAPVESQPTVELQDNPFNFDELHAQNPDICGWIKVPGTAIDYPILQSGDDLEEDYYLNHDTDRKYRFAGCIYIQRLNRSDFSDPNTVIYGHNMLNGTMFAALKKYRNAEFFNTNSAIYIYCPGHILTYQIYSAFVYDDRHILNSFHFHEEEGYSAFLEETLNPTSLVRQLRAGVSVTTDDRIVTLSTCTSVDTERYLVVGVLTDDTLTR